MDRYEVATPQACPGSTSHPPTAASSGLRRAPSETSRHRRVKSELADANASNQRRHGSWVVGTGPGTDAMGEIADRVRFDIVPTTTTTVVTSLTGPARLFCQKARDRPGLDARRDRVPETSLAFEKVVSTTTPPRGSSTCGRVHGRAGLRQVPQKRLKRAHRAPDGHGL